jgi:hypothetical protein
MVQHFVIRRAVRYDFQFAVMMALHDIRVDAKVPAPLFRKILDARASDAWIIR